MHVRDIEDVYKGSDDRHLVLRRVRRGPSVTFASPARESILKVYAFAGNRSTINAPAQAVHAAKQRAVVMKPLVMPVSDISATLLAIGLLHACDPSEDIRSAALDLLTASCLYLRYSFDAQIPWRGLSDDILDRISDARIPHRQFRSLEFSGVHRQLQRPCRHLCSSDHS